MNTEQDEYEVFAKRMEEKFPAMFTQPYGGFCVNKGWWIMLETMCDLIQSHIDWNNKRAAAHPELMYKPVEQVVVAQIKEKFGGLRFYYDGGNDIISGMVTMAEAMASKTCETCGKPGQQRSGGWIKTLCDEHEVERQRRLAKLDVDTNTIV